MKTHWEVQVTENEQGETILPFPPDLLAQEGWLEDDEIEFVATENNSFTLVNISKQKRLSEAA